MKALILFFYTLLCAISSCAQSPNANEWLRQKKTQRNYLIQQIAALEVYYNYLKKGYEIADKGLTLIGEVKDGAFLNDKTYIESLRNVSAAVRDSPRLTGVITFRNNILELLRGLVSECRKSEFYTSEEVRYVEKVHENMVRQCAATMNELELLVSTETEMKDDERITRLDKVYQVMQDREAFARCFCDDVRFIGYERAKSKHDTSTLSKLNDL